MPFISDLIYSSPKSCPQKRAQPMQVLAVGLSRTGTESLCRALSMLGYDHVYHGFDFLKQPEQVRPWVELLERKISSNNPQISAADFDRIIGHCVAVTDLPCSALAAELIAAYPGAKVIINKRSDPNAWWESYVKTVDPLVSNRLYTFKCYFDGEAYWARRLVCDVQKIHYGGDFRTHGMAGYERHYDEMRRLAGSRALEWTFEDGWTSLCKYLDKPEPTSAFPRGNDPMAFETEKIRVTMDRFRRSDRNIGIFCAGVLCIIAMSLASILFNHGRIP